MAKERRNWLTTTEEYSFTFFFLRKNYHEKDRKEAHVRGNLIQSTEEISPQRLNDKINTKHRDSELKRKPIENKAILTEN